MPSDARGPRPTKDDREPRVVRLEELTNEKSLFAHGRLQQLRAQEEVTE